MEQFGRVLDGTWCNGRRNALTGMTLRRYQTCRRQTQRGSYKRDQEGRAEKLCWHGNLHYRPS